MLIVDDDPDMAACLLDLVTAEGFSAFRAPDGLQGLAHAESWPPRVVLLDLRMPVLDGWAFLERWREHPRLHTVPVVVVSSEPVQADLERTVRAWLAKPVDAERLIRIVGLCLCEQPGAADTPEGARRSTGSA